MAMPVTCAQRPWAGEVETCCAAVCCLVCMLADCSCLMTLITWGNSR